MIQLFVCKDEECLFDTRVQSVLSSVRTYGALIVRCHLLEMLPDPCLFTLPVEPTFENWELQQSSRTKAANQLGKLHDHRDHLRNTIGMKKAKKGNRLSGVHTTNEYLTSLLRTQISPLHFAATTHFTKSANKDGKIEQKRENLIKSMK